MKWRDLAERQINNAQAEGQLDDLRGAGKPLPAAGHGDFAELQQQLNVQEEARRKYYSSRD